MFYKFCIIALVTANVTVLKKLRIIANGSRLVNSKTYSTNIFIVQSVSENARFLSVTDSLTDFVELTSPSEKFEGRPNCNHIYFLRLSCNLK